MSWPNITGLIKDDLRPENRGAYARWNLSFCNDFAKSICCLRFLAGGALKKVGCAKNKAGRFQGNNTGENVNYFHVPGA
ncbi:MAG: hypothetical protein WAW36_05450 [Methylovulum miyakonense]|uniref:hypothetical protein n=1 Tax=Methylovulum miyakonense TaxID=645578 RepID=UPI003BB693C8